MNWFQRLLPSSEALIVGHWCDETIRNCFSRVCSWGLTDLPRALGDALVQWPWLKAGRRQALALRSVSIDTVLISTDWEVREFPPHTGSNLSQIPFPTSEFFSDSSDKYWLTYPLVPLLHGRLANVALRLPPRHLSVWEAGLSSKKVLGGQLWGCSTLLGTNLGARLLVRHKTNTGRGIHTQGAPYQLNATKIMVLTLS